MNFFDQLLVLFGGRSVANSIAKAEAESQQQTAELIRQVSYERADRETELEELIEKLEQKIDELEDRVSDLEMKVDDLETDQVLNDYEYLSDRVDFLEDYIMNPTREVMENEDQQGDGDKSD